MPTIVRNYAVLDGSGFIPTANLGSGSAGSGNFLRGDQSWQAAGGVASIYQTEIDFGSTPLWEKEFTVVDASVSPTSQITAQLAYEAPTDKDLDELEMDSLDLICGPGSGQFTIYAKGLFGPVAGKFKVNYLIG